MNIIPQLRICAYSMCTLRRDCLWRKKLYLQTETDAKPHKAVHLETIEEQRKESYMTNESVVHNGYHIFSGMNSLLKLLSQHNKCLLHFYINNNCFILPTTTGHFNLAIPQTPETQHCHNNSYFFLRPAHSIVPTHSITKYSNHGIILNCPISSTVHYQIKLIPSLNFLLHFFSPSTWLLFQLRSVYFPTFPITFTCLLIRSLFLLQSTLHSCQIPPKQSWFWYFLVEKSFVDSIYA